MDKVARGRAVREPTESEGPKYESGRARLNALCCSLLLPPLCSFTKFSFSREETAPVSLLVGLINAASSERLETFPAGKFILPLILFSNVVSMLAVTGLVIAFIRDAVDHDILLIH